MNKHTKPIKRQRINDHAGISHSISSQRVEKASRYYTFAERNRAVLLHPSSSIASLTLSRPRRDNSPSLAASLLPRWDDALAVEHFIKWSVKINNRENNVMVHVAADSLYTHSVISISPKLHLRNYDIHQNMNEPESDGEWKNSWRKICVEKYERCIAWRH